MKTSSSEGTIRRASRGARPAASSAAWTAGRSRAILDRHVEVMAEESDALDPRDAGQDVARPPGLRDEDLDQVARHQALDPTGRIQGQESPLVHEADSVAPLGLVQVGRGDHDRHPLLQHLVEDPPEVPPRDRVHAVGGLVQQQDLRRVDQRAGQAQLLFHSARELVGQPVLERGEVAETQQALDARRPLLARDLEEVRVEEEVLQHGEVAVETEALGHVRDTVLDRLGLRSNGVAGDERVALRRSQDPRQHPQGRGLPGAVRTDQPEQFPARDREGEVIHGGDGSEPPRQIPDLDRRPLVALKSPAVISLPSPAPRRPTPGLIRASAGMPGFSSWFGLSTLIFTAKTSFTRSSCVWTFLGVNSASELMKVTFPG